MWDLPRPGLKPVSPALAGRFSTTVPPGKPIYILFKLAQLCYLKICVSINFEIPGHRCYQEQNPQVGWQMKDTPLDIRDSPAGCWENSKPILLAVKWVWSYLTWSYIIGPHNLSQKPCRGSTGIPDLIVIIANYTNSQWKLLPASLPMTSLIRGPLTCMCCEHINCNYCFGSCNV